MMTPLDTKAMDANSEALGVGAARLMGNAGRAVADLLSDRYPGRRIVFFCGHGDNGGDGFAAASMMEDADVAVCLIDPAAKIRSEAALTYFYKLRCGRSGMPYEGDFDVLVDCGLGTGASGSLRPPYSEFVDFANGFGGDVVSVDVPTGFGGEKSVRPKTTVTMHDVKEGMDEGSCGEIVVADIGMPEDAWRFTGPGDMLRYPVPSDDSHKGDNGRLLIVGGGPYCGAPALSGLAALRCGVDTVTIATPESGYGETASFSPVFVMKRLKGEAATDAHLDEVLGYAEGCDAVLVGPGIGRGEGTQRLVRALCDGLDRPTVVDADGLFALGDSFAAKRGGLVLTPHRGEFAGLGGEDAESLARRTGCTVLLKGREDVISDGKRTRRNRTGCAGMTGAGTGDVLAGIVAGLMAKGVPPFDAACLGAYISGKAGEYAFGKRSYGMTATDVVERIPKVRRKGLSERRRWISSPCRVSPR